jgi:hypothetical protein
MGERELSDIIRREMEKRDSLERERERGKKKRAKYYKTYTTK